MTVSFHKAAPGFFPGEYVIHQWLEVLVYQKQVSSARISNYIPDILWDVINYLCPRYHLNSNIRCTKFQTTKFLISSCSCLCPINWSQMLSLVWRCSWSSADRRCSNYIWVINNFIACKGVAYIRGLTVPAIIHALDTCFWYTSPQIQCIDAIATVPLPQEWSNPERHGKINLFQNTTMHKLYAQCLKSRP